MLDDGQGIAASSASVRAGASGMGISGLQSRLQRLGGQVQWLSGAEYGYVSGTLVRLQLPFKALLGVEHSA